MGSKPKVIDSNIHQEKFKDLLKLFTFPRNEQYKIWTVDLVDLSSRFDGIYKGFSKYMQEYLGNVIQVPDYNVDKNFDVTGYKKVENGISKIRIAVEDDKREWKLLIQSLLNQKFSSLREFGKLVTEGGDDEARKKRAENYLKNLKDAQLKMINTALTTTVAPYEKTIFRLKEIIQKYIDLLSDMKGAILLSYYNTQTEKPIYVNMNAGKAFDKKFVEYTQKRLDYMVNALVTTLLPQQNGTVTSKIVTLLPGTSENDEEMDTRENVGVTLNSLTDSYETEQEKITKEYEEEMDKLKDEYKTKIDALNESFQDDKSSLPYIAAKLEIKRWKSDKAIEIEVNMLKKITDLINKYDESKERILEMKKNSE